MKFLKFFIFSVFFLCVGICSANASMPRPYPVKTDLLNRFTNLEDYFKFKIRIFFTLDPLGVGIEAEFGVASPTNINNPSVIGISNMTSEGKLSITLDKTTLPREVTARFFTKGMFKITKQGTVSTAALRDMGAKVNTYIIKPGLYKTVDNGKTITIVL